MNATNKTCRAACPQAAAAVERAASPFRPRTRWQRVLPAAALAAAVLALPFASLADSATLTHRWSFNGAPGNANLVTNLYDSVGGLHATMNGSCVTFQDGKAELHGYGKGTGYITLGTNLLDANAATVEMWATKHGTVDWSRIFEYSVNSTYFIAHCWSNAKSEKCTLCCYSNGKKFDTTIDSFAYDCETPYHISMTVLKNSNGSTTIRIMARDTKTGSLVLDNSGTASDWTLADYTNPSLTLGYSTSNNKDGFAAYDEVRIYRGIVGDEQLAANAVAGPDALVPAIAETSATGFNVPSGSSFVVSATNAISFTGTATFGVGAKLVFDVSNFNGGSASFYAPSYVLEGGESSILDIVEVSDPDFYEATLANGRVTVSPKAAFTSTAATAVWKGGATVPDARALENPANWASTNFAGVAVSAAPSAYTDVIIPAGSTAFTIPSGYTPNWRSVKFGGVSQMNWARKKYSGTRSDIDVANSDAASWKYMAILDYDTANGTSANFSSLGWAASDWAISQRRFDGWFYVSPANEGMWKFANTYDDYFAFSIDGEWVIDIITYSATHRSTRYLKAGWHRFTIVCGDTWGVNSSSLLMDVSINGGSTVKFDTLTFGSGSAQTITLAADCDWRGLGALDVASDVTIDLNGHDLYVDSITSSFIGAKVINSVGTAATIHGGVDAKNLVIADTVTVAALPIHRWRFNGDLTDSTGGADATYLGTAGTFSSDGQAVMNDNGSINLGSGILGDKDATFEFWVTQDKQVNAWVYMFAIGGTPGVENEDYVYNNMLQFGWREYRTGYLYGTMGFYLQGTTLASGNLPPFICGVPFHVAVTFKDNGGSTTVRWMVRDTATGGILYEDSATRYGWTLANAHDWPVTLGRNCWRNGDQNSYGRFAEARVWNGVLSDDQLARNAVSNPDDLALGSVSGISVAPGETYDVTTAGGYGQIVDGKVTLGVGAKLRFDTANCVSGTLRLKTAGFRLPAGVTSVTSMVELTDADNYTVSTEDGGNTIKVSLNSSMPLTSVWKGGTPASAADLANASNWASTNAAGTAISAAPGSRTTVIIPTSKLATFTIPDGTTVNWGRVLLGGYTATTAARLATAPSLLASDAWSTAGVSSYTEYIGATGITEINGTGSDNASGTFLSDYVEDSQVRFDGWFYVPADKAGRWDFTGFFDDALAFDIDGALVYRYAYNAKTQGGACYVSEGWHHFTLRVMDDGGGYGSNVSLDGVNVPFTISVNGGSPIAFHSFTFGTEEPSITLDSDRNWAAIGPITFANGITIDLNGHNLTVADGTSDYVGAKIVNSDTSNASTVYTYSGSLDSALTSGSAGTVNVETVTAATATWTGAGGTGLANDHRNWNCYDSTSTLLPGALPISSTTVTVNNDSIATVNDGMALAWGATTFGTGPNGGLYQDGGSLAINGNYLIGNTANKTTTNTISGGTLTTTGNLRMGGVSGAKGVLNIEGGSVTVPNVSIPLVAGGNSEINVYNGLFKVTGWVDFAQNTGSNVWNQSGGEVSVGGNFWIGRNNSGVGIYNLSGGKLSSTGGSFDIGRFSPGYFNMSGGTLSATVATCVGRDGNGWFHQTDGDFTVNNCFRMGWGSYTGEYTLDGGTLTITSWLGIGAGDNGTGHFVQNGGTFNILNENFSVADNGVGTYTFNDGEINAQRLTVGCWNRTRCNGTFVMNGGTLNVSEGSTYDTSSHWFWIGREKVGSFTQNGGEINAYSGVMLAKESTATGTLALNGGVLRTRFLKKGAGTANTVTFAGGKIAVLDENYDSSAFFDGFTSFAFGAGGLTFDTAGYDVTMSSGTLTSTADGSLFRKEGEGTFTIHTLPPVDDIYVDGGVLALSASVDNSGEGRTLTIAEGATLSLGANTLTQPVLAGNGTVSGGTLTPGAIHLNVGDCLTVDGGTLDISSAMVELLDPDNLAEAFVFARTANGGTISGTAATGASVRSGWYVEVADGEAWLKRLPKRELTWTNTAHDFLFDNLANWTVEGEAATALPLDGDEVTLIVSGSTPITVTNCLYALESVAVSGSGEASFLLSGGGGISFPALDIGQGATVTLTNLMGLVDGGLTGRGTLVLDPGAGNTLTMTKDNGNNAVPFDAEYFWGEAVIKSGTVKFGNIWSFGSRRDSDDNRQVPTVRVKGGATLDENAMSTSDYAGETLRVILEEGATLKSTGNSSSGLTSLILEGDATVDTSSGKVVACFGLDSYGSTPVSVSLGNHTLTKVGSGQFYLSACDFSGTGTLDVQQGEVCVRVDSWNYFPTSTFASGTLRVRSGATFSLVKRGDNPTHFTVANLVLDGTLSTGDGCTLTVTGAASGSGSATAVTLAEGAVIRPDGTGFFTAATISGAIVLDVADAVSAASATGVVPLFKVGSAEALPAAGSISFTGGLPAGWSLVQTEDGLGYELRARGVMFMVY
ncbi:MAG: hypothetical protein IJI54_12915 [Kiritimatiellae bacterium]|nr:hypothetical protein [Kiritimatiellia bacterium]